MAKRSRAVKDIVYARDCGTCQMCDASRQLQVHHVHQLVDGGADDELNAILLCKNCHEKTHKVYSNGLHWSKFYEYLEQERRKRK